LIIVTEQAAATSETTSSTGSDSTLPSPIGSSTTTTVSGAQSNKNVNKYQNSTQLRRMVMILKLLEASPEKASTLAALCKCNIDTVLLSLKKLIQLGEVKRYEGDRHYYARTGVTYDLSNVLTTRNIRSIPPLFFSKIPIIRRWSAFATSPARRRYIEDFRINWRFLWFEANTLHKS
jgi:hypothetical protein